MRRGSGRASTLALRLSSREGAGRRSSPSKPDSTSANFTHYARWTRPSHLRHPLKLETKTKAKKERKHVRVRGPVIAIHRTAGRHRRCAPGARTVTDGSPGVLLVVTLAAQCLLAGKLYLHSSALWLWAGAPSRFLQCSPTG